MSVISSVLTGAVNIDADFEPGKRLSADPSHLLTNVVFGDNDLGKYMVYNDKRELNKKWVKLFQESHSPYKIAFPALIRSRRFILPEEK